MYLLPCTVLVCVVALRTETSLTIWLVSLPVFLVQVVVHRCWLTSVLCTRLASLLLALHAVVLWPYGWLVWEAIQVQIVKKKNKLRVVRVAFSHPQWLCTFRGLVRNWNLYLLSPYIGFFIFRVLICPLLLAATYLRFYFKFIETQGSDDCQQFAILLLSFSLDSTVV
jgi:hypothetical protein